MPTQIEKLYQSVMSGMQDNNIKFRDLRNLLENLGFEYRIKGDHFIYFAENIPDNINIQPIGNKAKPYQVRQIRNYLLKYHIGL